MAQDNQHSWAVRMLRGFGMFWWDFLIGDTPELFVSTVVLIGIVAALSLAGHWRWASVIVLPLGAALMLLGSVLKAIKAKKASSS